MMAGTSTFQAWIRKQTAHLSGQRTTDMRRLAAAAQDDRPRLAAPLLLYALSTGKTDRLMSLVWSDEIRDSYASARQLLEGHDIEQMALTNTAPRELPREYRKFLDLYRTYRNLPEKTRQAKQQRRLKAIELQNRLGIPTARISESLAINNGNLNAWLKHGDDRLMTAENAARIVRLLRNMAKEQA